ncbi:MAG: serine hydrolase domain-containing protein [Bacteroidales bacterium]
MRTIIHFLLCLLLLSSCSFYKAITYKGPHVYDYQNRDQALFSSSSKAFKWKLNLSWDLNDSCFCKCPENKNVVFQDILKKNKTYALLIFQNDSLVYFYKHPNFDVEQKVNSFSISKSILSALLGIAIGEGYIDNIKDSVGKYVKEANSKISKICLEDLLNMRVRFFRDTTFFNRGIQSVSLYYGKNIKKHLHKAVPEPDKKGFFYCNLSSLLLTWVLEEATNMPMEEYFNSRLWKPLRTNYNASWILDSKKNHFPLGFCCLNITVYDLALFGRLYINNGEVDNKQVIPSFWVEEAFNPNSFSNLDEQKYEYKHSWRIGEKGKQIFAKGLKGQYLFIDREKNIMIVRVGGSMKKTNWGQIFQEIIKRYTNSSSKETDSNSNEELQTDRQGLR